MSSGRPDGATTPPAEDCPGCGMLQKPCYFHRAMHEAAAEAAADAENVIDAINPPHYTAHPSGIDCIQITEHMNFCLGNAVKYIWRAGLKGEALEDLRKAIWYIDREIRRRGD